MHTLKINGRNVGKTKEIIKLMIEMLEDSNKNLVAIVAGAKNQPAYLKSLKDAGFDIDIIEQNESAVTIKCKRQQIS